MTTGHSVLCLLGVETSDCQAPLSALPLQRWLGRQAGEGQVQLASALSQRSGVSCESGSRVDPDNMFGIFPEPGVAKVSVIPKEKYGQQSFGNTKYDIYTLCMFYIILNYCINCPEYFSFWKVEYIKKDSIRSQKQKINCYS